jgi:acetylglutamate/LysW-gamma-L-alpha-aminoadipate kinase
MVYCGQVNKGLVELLQQRGVNAVGLSGIDGRLWEGDRKAAIRSVENGKTRIIRDDFTGKVTTINTHLLQTLMEGGYQPVLTAPAISTVGEAINVDADRAAAMTAGALKAHTLMMLSNVPGLLADFPDESSLIREVKRSDIETAAEAAQDRMKKKVLGAAEALDDGVGRVIFGDARIENPITSALAGKGTVFS